MENILSITGSWIWIILGLLLLGIEILLPSTFLLWPGLAAVLVGVVTVIVGLDNPMWPWQAQVIVFLVSSLVIAWVGKEYLKQRKLEASDKPNLNERGRQLVGQTSTLSAPIKNGHGRAKFGDSSWTIRGPDLKAGTTVRVTDSEGSVLIVEQV